MPKLTDKQRKFIKFYNMMQNAYKAAKEAGYSENYAKHKSGNLLKQPEIKGLLDRHTNRSLEKLDITEEMIAAELAKIAFSNMDDFATWDAFNNVTLTASDKLTRMNKAAIAEIQQTVNSVGHNLKIKKHDKIKALELLGKYKKMFTEKVDHSNSDGSMQPNTFIFQECRKEDIN